MQLKSLLPAALAWSSTATGLLIPTDTSGEALKALSNDVSSQASELSWAVQIPCEGCAVVKEKKEDGTYEFDEADKRDNSISVSFTKKDGKIFVGGSVVYPLSQAHGPVIGQQLAQDDSMSLATVTADQLHLATRSESHFIRTLPKDESPGNSPLDISAFNMEVLGMEDKVVHVGTVEILVGTSHESGEVIIMGQAALIPTVATPADAQCEIIICRVRTQMAQKLSAAKTAATTAMGKLKAGCKGMLGMHPHGPPHHGMPPHHGHPHGQEQQGNSNNGQAMNAADRVKGGPRKFAGHRKPCPGRHGVMNRIAWGVVIFTRAFLRVVLLPAFVGLTIGLLIRRWNARRQALNNGGYIVVEQVDVDIEQQKQDDEDAEPLPVYEAGEHVLPPAYSDEEKRESEN